MDGLGPIGANPRVRAWGGALPMEGPGAARSSGEPCTETTAEPSGPPPCASVSSVARHGPSCGRSWLQPAL